MPTETQIQAEFNRAVRKTVDGASFGAPVSSIYLRSDGWAGTTFYVKESGTGNTGWVAK